MVLRVCYVLLILVSSLSYVDAQSKYWIFLENKGGQPPDVSYVSGKTIGNRQSLGIPLVQATDIPVYQPYVDSLKHYGVEVLLKSKWLNAISVYIKSSNRDVIQDLGFVREVRVMNACAVPAGDKPLDPAYRINNYAIKQTNAGDLLKNGLTGNDVLIGIIDGNFYHADRNSSLSQVFENNRLLGFRDFVDPHTTDFFDIGNNPRDIHASVVWQLIAGYDKESDRQYGLAPNASFYLARTDERDNETQKEEDRWVVALEWLDSLGVRLVHSSLGYSFDFDDPSEDHKPDDMDGQTTAISKAAKIATEEKGMIIVTSAGNEGKVNNWKIVTAPADVKGVIAVGATLESGLKAESSSVGSDKVGFVKPDFACFSQGGTSLAAPIITGIVACLLQIDPSLRPEEVKDILVRSASLQPYANNFVGFGVPDAEKAVLAMKNEESKISSKEVHTRKKKFRIKDQKVGDQALVFHKRDELHVISNEVIENSEGSFYIGRMPGVKRSTVVVKSIIYEIFWN